MYVAEGNAGNAGDGAGGGSWRRKRADHRAVTLPVRSEEEFRVEDLRDAAKRECGGPYTYTYTYIYTYTYTYIYHEIDNDIDNNY